MTMPTASSNDGGDVLWWAAVAEDDVVVRVGEDRGRKNAPSLISICVSEDRARDHPPWTTA